MSEMGKRVRALRKALGMTQVQLARQVGVSQSAISDIERGDTTDVMGPTLSALCTRLRTNPEWLLNGIGHPGPALATNIETNELVAVFRSLSDEHRAVVLSVARTLQHESAPGPSEVNPYPKRSVEKGD